jgi:hypothetical protein
MKFPVNFDVIEFEHIPTINYRFSSFDIRYFKTSATELRVILTCEYINLTS